MILLAYRHGLRVGELCALRWDQADFCQGLLHVTTAEARCAIRSPVGRRGASYCGGSSPRHGMCSKASAMPRPAGLRKTLAWVGEASPLAFPVHPNMLRHACGFKLANAGGARERYSVTSGTGTFSPRCAIPS